MIRCLNPKCLSDQIERLAWCNVNEQDWLKPSFREWEKDRGDMHAAQVQCGDCETVFPISDLQHMDDGND